jgi:MFS family permease
MYTFVTYDIGFWWFSEAMGMMFTPFLSSSLGFTCTETTTKGQAVWLTVVVFVGMSLGSSTYCDYQPAYLAVFFSWLCERIGRRITLIISAFITVLGHFMVVFSTNYAVGVQRKFFA